MRTRALLATVLLSCSTAAAQTAEETFAFVFLNMEHGMVQSSPAVFEYDEGKDTITRISDCVYDVEYEGQSPGTVRFDVSRVEKLETPSVRLEGQAGSGIRNEIYYPGIICTGDVTDDDIICHGNAYMYENVSRHLQAFAYFREEFCEARAF